MKIKVNKLLGSTSIVFEVDNPNIKDALYSAGILASMPTKCKCESEDVILASNSAKGYTFVYVKCNKCVSKAQLGEYKDKSGYYWKEWEKYIPQGGGRDENVPIIEQ